MSFFTQTPQNSQKGEVAWFLTVISMLTIALGLVIGLNTTSSDQAFTRSTDAVGDGVYRGKHIGRTDGQFISIGRTCGGNFDTQIDPYIADIIITRPPTKDWPGAGAQMFSLVDDGGATGIRDLLFVKNYSFTVQFNPTDATKNTPNPRDILVTYKAPTKAAQRFIIDEKKVPDWVQNADTEILLVWSYKKYDPSLPPTDPKQPQNYVFTSATSKGCPGPNTPTPTIPLTLTPTTTATPTPPTTLTTTPTGTPPVTPTGGVTPAINACYDRCTTSAQCGRHVDPATDIYQQMLCLEKLPRGGTFAAPAFSSKFFIAQSGSQGIDQPEPFPFYAQGSIIDIEHQGLYNYSDIAPAKWQNSKGTVGEFRALDFEDPTIDKSYVRWRIDQVPTNLQNQEFNITLRDLPSKYVVTGKYCSDDSWGSQRPDGCGNYAANNGSNTDINTVYGIKILKGAYVEYGWEIRLKSSIPTTAPTTAPTNAPTAVPTAVPTTSPKGAVCQQLLAKNIPAATLQAAIDNPGSIPGWGQAEDPSRPVSPSNPIRNLLSLRDINQPYHPILNGLVYKARCDSPVPPTTAPTAVPTQTPGHAVCDPLKGVDCRCMPPSCTGRDCSTKPLACDKPSIITDAPTPTPVQKAQCIYNGLTFVEECQNIDPATGLCMPMFGTNRLDALPIPQAELIKESPNSWRMWSPLNDRQRDNSTTRRPDNEKPADDNRFNFITSAQAEFAELMRTFTFFNFGRNNTAGISMSPRQRSVQDVLTNFEPRQLLQPRTDIKIASTEEIQRSLKTGDRLDTYVPYEQYNNMQDSTVQLFYDKDNYRIVPNGKNIYSCTNAIAQKLQDEGKLDPATDQSIINMTAGIGACNMNEYTSNPQNREEIKGLTIGCGQDIVYGWTLQKCSFNYDYVFVVDTSTTMGKPDKNLGGKSKIDAAVDQMETFVNAIEQSGSDSRIALVNFNNAVHVYENDMKTIKDEDKDGFGNGVQTHGLLPRGQFNRVRDQFPRFRKTKENGGLLEKGSCMKCGLDLANQILNEKRTDAEKQARHGVVIFLSDGLPNSYPGDVDPKLMAAYPAAAQGNVEPWSWGGNYEAADRLRSDGAITTGFDPINGAIRSQRQNVPVYDDVLLTTLTFGDASKTADEGQHFKLFSNSVASDKASTAGRWAYSTDPSNNAPISISSIFGQVQKDLNTCAMATLAFDVSMKARDVNKDGVINLIDLSIVWDALDQTGDDLKEDINGDNVVNVLDGTLVLNSIGTVVNTPDAPTPTPVKAE